MQKRLEDIIPIMGVEQDCILSKHPANIQVDNYALRTHPVMISYG